MTRIHIQTRNIAGDEELIEALRMILDQLEEGETSGQFEQQDGEPCDWAVNSTDPTFLSD